MPTASLQLDHKAKIATKWISVVWPLDNTDPEERPHRLSVHVEHVEGLSLKAS